MKKCLSFIITAMMFTAMTPLLSVPDEVNAAEVKTAYCEWVNPAYEDVIDVSDLAEPDKISLHTEYGISAASDGEYLTTVEEAAEEMRDQLKARSDTVTILYQSETDPGKSTDFVREIYYAAREHTGIPTEGDYLRYQIGGYKCSISYKTSNSLYLCTLTYTITYYTTAAQEAEMDEAVASLISDLDLKDKTDYQKIKSIYDYMCSNISYDYDNLEDDTYMLKYTAYAALINRTAVCQGYANLFYRLALEAGVDARLITGTGNGGGHAWNIANLGDSYYYLDSTWDAGRASYKYYLKGKTDFGDHQNGEEFSSDEFFARYMIPETGYEICSAHTFSTEWKTDADKHWHGCTNCGEKGSEAAHTFEWVTDKAATEEATGLKHEECTVCGYKQNENTEIPVLSHTHSMVRTEAAAATCTEDGNTEYYTCSKCGKLYSDEAGNNEITKEETVDKAAGHKYSDWKTVKDATCTEAGTKTRECEVCGAEETAEIAATGHNWKDEYTVDKAATYAAAGTESIHCMTCDEVKEGTETAIPKLVCRLAGPSEASANLTSYYGSTAGYDDLKITWDKVEGADGYYVRYKAATSSTWKWASPTEKNYKYLKNLSDGIRYNIRVYPYVKENGVNYRSENYKPLTSVYTLKKVTVPTVSKMSSGYVKVKWKGISGETGYQIYRATSKNGKYTKVKSVTMSSSSYPYARIKTTKNKTYYYKVRAYKSLGSGKYVYGPFSSVKAYKLK